MVEGRFVCRNLQDAEGNEGRSGKLIDMVVDESDPVFKVATPAGGITMIIASEAAKQFILNTKYRVTFEKIV